MGVAVVAVGEGLGDVVLMGDEDDSVQVGAEVVEFLDHGLTVVGVEAAEAFVDDDAAHGAVVVAGVLADGEREGHGDAESLAAAEKRGVDGRGRSVGVGGQIQGAFGRLVGGDAQLQVQRAVGKTVQDGVGVFHDLPLGRSHQVALKSLPAQQVG